MHAPDNQNLRPESRISRICHFSIQVIADTCSKYEKQTSNEAGDEGSSWRPPRSLASARVFLNNLLVSKIGHHLPTGDLLQLRRISPSLNQVFVMNLKGNRAKAKWDMNDMDQFTARMRSSSGIPFTQYKITDISSIQDQDFDEFFNVCGKFAKQLWLVSISADPHMVPGKDVAKTRKAIFQLTPELVDLELSVRNRRREADPPQTGEDPGAGTIATALPKLRRLPIQCCHKPVSDWQKLFNDLLQHATGLKVLEITGAGSGKLGHAPVLLALRDFAQQLQNLTTLELMHFAGIQADEIEILVELASRKCHPLRLEAFGAYIPDKNCVENLFYRFLRTQAPTLRHLQLHFKTRLWCRRESESRLHQVRIPLLDKLVRFKLSNRQDMPVLFDGAGGTVYGAMRNLKSLVIASYDKFEFEFEHGSVANLALAEVLPLTAQPVELEVGELATSLRSLTSIDLMWDSGRNPTLLWAMAPQLRRILLRVRDKENCQGQTGIKLDQLLTGVPEAQFIKLQRDIHTHPPSSVDEIQGLVAKYKSKPGLSDLKDLRQFTLEFQIDGGSDGSAPQYEMTDITGYLGFAVCGRTLRQLLIGRGRCLDAPYPGNKISEECLEFVKSVVAPWAVVVINGMN